ncbi:SMI1/KNR4 family protein [Glycomyces sp. A-F 0318]|uniref:SMI1/KNR4 family protein n=1 Tax=Glycomyces amatae TaxID=2881355 RepID=UPI001E34B121|nr:SMI1/KNR4 family protein [Glycomyces amatae]MCD0445834.1 SMI1/KNR4 family protein [Glycomyces amatae]
MDTAAPAPQHWPARVYPVMRGLVALASLSIDGHLRAGPPRPRATPAAIAAYEHGTGVRLDASHRQFLLHLNGWPALWPVALFGLPELGDQSRMECLTTELAKTGDLAAAGLGPADVYPVAWAGEGGTAVAVRPGHARAGEILWCEGIHTSVYAGFDAFYDAVADRLLVVCGPLAGGTAAPPSGVASSTSHTQSRASRGHGRA